MYRYESVSYTHLDVYKRQLSYSTVMSHSKLQPNSNAVAACSYPKLFVLVKYLIIFKIIFIARSIWSVCCCRRNLEIMIIKMQRVYSLDKCIDKHGVIIF